VTGLDYSAARLAGGAIRSAGYDFVIRYVGTPGRTKNIAPFEYADLLAAGVAVALVYENVAEDALGGFAAGQGAARAARADADSIGFPANRPIYFAVDWVATAPQMPAVMAYLDGAASVLGVENVGVYGFQLTIRMAMDGGHAHWFWQCGAISALVPGTHLYQHNNDNTTVSGITCDVNDALAPDFGQNTQTTGGFLMALADWQQQRMFDRILSMSQGVAGQNYDGDQFAREQTQRAATDAALGQVLQLVGKQQGVSATDIATALAPRVIAALPAHLNTLGAADLAAIAKAVTDEESRRLSA
jgi:hypothetical protein